MAEKLVGYAALQARMHAVGGAGSSPALMRLLGLAAVREAKLLVRRKTGNTGRTIRLASATAKSAVIEAGGAAPFLEYGTRPHEITPRAAMALRWAASSSKGFRLSGRPSSAKGNQIGWAFAKVVHHPGTKPHPFLLPGARLAVQQAGAGSVVRAWNEAA